MLERSAWELGGPRDVGEECLGTGRATGCWRGVPGNWEGHGMLERGACEEPLHAVILLRTPPGNSMPECPPHRE